MGVEVHVALPDLNGRIAERWRQGGAQIHVAAADFSPRRPGEVSGVVRGLRELVTAIAPDLVHSHFVSSTLLIRWALGAESRIPRIFQVPGPLHLEHTLWRNIEIASASSPDVWIASSQCILKHYRRARVADSRLYLSYYGANLENYSFDRRGELRVRFGIPERARIVGNANFIYPPKWYLGQHRGLKAHEDVIDALEIVLRAKPDVVGVLIGGGFPHPTPYEESLHRRARHAGHGRIFMTGYLPQAEICRMWPDFDLCVHVPMSENCGGVVEPMLAGVPVIAGRVGGLPEVVLDGLTGTTVPVRNPAVLAQEVMKTLGSEVSARAMATTARALVEAMFDIKRTAREVFEIYARILNPGSGHPVPFDSKTFLKQRQPKRVSPTYA